VPAGLKPDEPMERSRSESAEKYLEV
jgi:hypothetical protein